ncbi:MAG: YlxR family protein [Coprothermobacterota bacterium]|nr:YlxR family protein [Coprothermobacterota bacterium]
MKGKHIPMRTCVGCGSAFPKKELLRIALTPEKELKFDPTGKLPGRGFYICPKSDCLERAIKNKNWAKKFNLVPGQDLISALKEAIGEEEGKVGED